jgi:hypothetical protein
MKEQNQAQYIIPARFRRLENLHIVFWLIKDISWCMLWKVLGIAMAVPTLSVAIYIAWRTRKIKSELAHNLAVTFWIAANSYWMVSEFYGFDEMPIWSGYEGKHLAMLPFLSGVLILMYYYLIQRPKEIRKQEAVTL